MNLGRLSLVILATVVIFAAGVVTGSLIVKRTARVQIAQPFWGRFEMTRRAVDELERSGNLTPEQRLRIDHLIQNSQELIADYFGILEPDVQQVFRKLRESIREQLTPDQRQRFEELARRRPRSGERRMQDGSRGGSGQPAPFPPDGNESRPPGSTERLPPNRPNP